MEEMLKMWFSNKLEHLEGLEISGKLIVPKKVISKGILTSETIEDSQEGQNTNNKNELQPKDYNNILNNIQLNTFNLSLVKNKVIIELEIKR